MTGSLVAALSPSPVASNYSVNSFSEYSTRSVDRATYSPTFAASGPRSARAKEEDEELFRDLFAVENDSEANEETSEGIQALRSAAPSFIPQKPVTRRAPPTTSHPNPRQHLAPLKSAPPQLVLTTPFIPRLKLEELVNARPDDEEDDDDVSRRTSRRGSDLEQVAEEDEFCLEDGPNEDWEGKAAPNKKQVFDRGFSSSLGYASNNQRSNNSELDQETLRFLEKLDLKTVLQTPRPDLLSFYPSTPTARSKASPDSKTPWITAKQEIGCEENSREKEQIAKEKKSETIFKEPPKSSRIDDVASRLAYMESTVDESGTIAIVMIPADATAWDDPRVSGSAQCSRVDCILGGWLITPTPWEGSCSVTWVMQANFGQCDPRAEFTGNQSCLGSFLDRRCLHAWADEIDHLIQALERVYDAEHYRSLGPLTAGGKSGATSSR
ncbi:hypothetical protein KRP22_002587 [Phytophthora ramorum]|nr:hypothetical protein KRP22_6234 [Phytophthora ramorum]